MSCNRSGFHAKTTPNPSVIRSRTRRARNSSTREFRHSAPLPQWPRNGPNTRRLHLLCDRMRSESRSGRHVVRHGAFRCQDRRQRRRSVQRLVKRALHVFSVALWRNVRPFRSAPRTAPSGAARLSELCEQARRPFLSLAARPRHDSFRPSPRSSAARSAPRHERRRVSTRLPPLGAFATFDAWTIAR